MAGIEFQGRLVMGNGRLEIAGQLPGGGVVVVAVGIGRLQNEHAPEAFGGIVDRAPVEQEIAQIQEQPDGLMAQFQATAEMNLGVHPVATASKHRPQLLVGQDTMGIGCQRLAVAHFFVGSIATAYADFRGRQPGFRRRIFPIDGLDDAALCPWFIPGCPAGQSQLMPVGGIVGAGVHRLGTQHHGFAKLSTLLGNAAKAVQGFSMIRLGL
jgi:hypothetical protein